MISNPNILASSILILKLLTVMAVNPLRKQYGTTQAGCEAVIELINNLIAIIFEQREIIAKQAEKFSFLKNGSKH